MKHTLDVSTVLKDFTGASLQEDGQDTILKNILLTFCRNGHQMKLNPTEESILYAVGMLIGIADKDVSFSLEQFDVLKKVVHSNRVTIQGQELPLYGILVAQQVKKFIEDASVPKKE